MCVLCVICVLVYRGSRRRKRKRRHLWIVIVLVQVGRWATSSAILTGVCLFAGGCVCVRETSRARKSDRVREKLSARPEVHGTFQRRQRYCISEVDWKL